MSSPRAFRFLRSPFSAVVAAAALAFLTLPSGYAADMVFDNCDRPRDWVGGADGDEFKEGSGSIIAQNPAGEKFPWTVRRASDEKTRNWSKYRYLTFWVYVKEAAPRKVYVVATCVGVEQTIKDFPYWNVPSYFVATFETNFKGWKKIVIPLKSFSRVRDANDWANIGSLHFSMGQLGGPQDGKYPAVQIDDIRLSDSAN